MNLKGRKGTIVIHAVLDQPLRTVIAGELFIGSTDVASAKVVFVRKIVIKRNELRESISFDTSYKLIVIANDLPSQKS